MTAWPSCTPCRFVLYSPGACPSLVSLPRACPSQSASVTRYASPRSRHSPDCLSHRASPASHAPPSSVAPAPRSPPALASGTSSCARCKSCSSLSAGAGSCCPRGLRSPWSGPQIYGFHLWSLSAKGAAHCTECLCLRGTGSGGVIARFCPGSNRVASKCYKSSPGSCRCQDVSEPCFQWTCRLHPHFHDIWFCKTVLFVKVDLKRN